MDTYRIDLSSSELSALRGALSVSIHQVDKLSADFQSQLDDCPDPKDYRILLNMSIDARERLDNMRSILSRVEGLTHG